jgi:3-hydroxybutyryl-CoA dehydrogenase
MTAEARVAALARVTTTTELGDIAAADLVVEAAPEDPPLKISLFQQLHGLCPESTIFATNTSSIGITLLAAGSGRPDRFVGLHFFNPVPMMPLVEVIRGVATSAETYDAALGFVRKLGKETVEAQDVPGFVVNLLLVPYLMDAVRALERGVASTVDIDRGMALGCGHPMGPLMLLDFVGLDTVVRIGEILFDGYREERYAPPALLRRMVAGGSLGRKSGKGFYDYAATPPAPVDLA